MRNRFKTLFILLFLFVTATTVAVVADDPTDDKFDFTIYRQLENGTRANAIPLENLDYGTTVTFDAGTGYPGKTFTSYIINEKLEINMNENNTFYVRGDLDVTALYREDTNFMVAFMDANQDVIDIQFVDESVTYTASAFSYTYLVNFLDPILGYVIDPVSPWTTWDDGDCIYTNVAEDTVCWVNYVSDDTFFTGPYTVSVTGGNADRPDYNYNEVATVTANGNIDDFLYWEKDGMIASINPSYTFTVLTDTNLTAHYAAGALNPNVLFINLIPYVNLLEEPPSTTYVGQFNVPLEHSLIEYGVITAPYSGGITLNTPDVVKIKSDKFNATTNEFVRHLDTLTFGTQTVRGYMITTDGSGVTITYSQMLPANNPTELTITGDTSVLTGNTIDLDVSILPVGASDEVQWISSDDSIATVDEYGIVTGITVGTVTITVVASGNHDVQDTYSVTVAAAVTYTINFNVIEGDNEPSMTDLEFGTILFQLPIPTKSGYTFNGWYTDEELSFAVTFPLLIFQDYDFYGEWILD